MAGKLYSKSTGGSTIAESECWTETVWRVWVSMRSKRIRLEKCHPPADLLLSAMKHVADHHHSRSYPDIGRKDWGDYVAIRILDALYHLNTILGENQSVPVSWGFKRGES